MRRFFSVLAAGLSAAMLCAIPALAENMTETAQSTDGAPVKVVTTIFPEYDWVREIAGDKAQITMLLDNGVDLHSYQPTAEDITKIATSDVFIYVGGESDGWVKDALAEAVNPDMKVINLLEVLGDTVKEEEVVEGMEHHDHDHEGADDAHDDHDHEDADDAHDDHDHEDADDAHDDHDHEDADDAHDDHDHEDADDAHDDHDHEHHHESDEHVWLSLRNTQILVSEIARQLGAADAENAQLYEENAAAYNEKLASLDAQYQKAVEEGSVKTVLFGDRFPFRYLVDDYDLDYFAAFAGCSAETEASFETVIFLAGKVDELGLHTILTIEGPDHKIAETIAENTTAEGVAIAVMDSMQGTTSEDVKNGATYLSIMEQNLEVLKEALK